MVIAALLLISIPQVDDTAKAVNDSPTVATKHMIQFRSGSGQWLTFESYAKRMKFKYLHGRESLMEKPSVSPRRTVRVSCGRLFSQPSRANPTLKLSAR